MSAQPSKQLPRLLLWLTGGTLLGAFTPVGLSLLEAVPRYLHKAGGGRGESSDWGEPLFFGVLLMVPGAFVGLLVGVVGWGIALGLRRANEEPQKQGPRDGP